MLAIGNMDSLSKTERLLAILLAALFVLFPTFISVSHGALALTLIAAAITFDKAAYLQTIRTNKVIRGLGLLLLMVVVGLMYKPSTSNWDWALLHLKKYAIFGYAIVLTVLLTNRAHLQKIALNAFIAGMLFVLASTWLNVWFLLPWSQSQNIGWEHSHHVFGDYVTQGVMMAFFSIITLHKAIQANNHRSRIGWGIVTLLNVIGITHLLQGRTGLLLLIVGLITYAMVALKGKRLILSLVGFMILTGIAIGSSDLIKNRIALAYEEAQRHDVDNQSSIGHRLFNYKTTPLLIMEKPVLGHGTGAYHTEICRVIGDPEVCKTYTWHPHNQFLFFGADHGLVGIALYLFLFICLYGTALKSPNRDAKIWLCTLTSILLCDSLINSPFYSSRESQFFGYMIALLVSMCVAPHTAESEPALN